MPNHCREATHFFLCVYIILIGLSSIYLSVGFPCDPYADLVWDSDRGAPRATYLRPSQSGRRRSCWMDCESYALRVHLLRNPELLNENPTISLVHSLVQLTQPNPFCFFNISAESQGNPFCTRQQSLYLTGTELENAGKEFQRKKTETMHLHALVLASLCIDCAVVSLAIVLIYVSTFPKCLPYVFTFTCTLSAHITSLFFSSHVARWLTCVPDGGTQRFCDGADEIFKMQGKINVVLPDKPIGVSNFEISLVIKNVNVGCIALAGLCYFSMKRTFVDLRGGHQQIHHPPPENQEILDPNGENEARENQHQD